MKAKTQYAIILSLIIFLAVILMNTTFPLKNTICLLLFLIADFYYDKKVHYKQNSTFFIFLLAISLIIPGVLMVYLKMDYLVFGPIVDAFIVSTISFVLLNYFIYG